MSFITGKPFVSSILESLSKEKAVQLYQLINNSNPELDGTYKLYSSYGALGTPLSDILNTTGTFKYVNLSYDAIIRGFFKGILVKIDNNKYGFLAWEPNTKVMSEIELYVAGGFTAVSEELTTEEFRRILGDLLIAGGGDDPTKVDISDISSGSVGAGKAIVSTSDGGAEWGDHVTIDVVNSLPSTGVEDTIYLSNSNVVTQDPTVEVPSPSVANAGKILGVGNNGKFAFMDGALPVLELDFGEPVSAENLNKLREGKYVVKDSSASTDLLYYPFSSLSNEVMYWSMDVRPNNKLVMSGFYNADIDSEEMTILGILLAFECPKVTANPTLAGTESALTSLQVGNTKYKIGGTQLYRHHISIGTEHLYIISDYSNNYVKTDFNSLFKLGVSFIAGYDVEADIAISYLNYDDQSDDIAIGFTNGGEDLYDATNFTDTVTAL